MPKSIFDLISPQLIGVYYTKVASNAVPYLGALLYPAKKQVGLDLSWIKGHDGLPVSLAPAAFDAKAPVRDRIGVEKIETEMPFFRESFRIGEKERQEILKVQGGANRAIIEPIISRIYADAAALVDGADVVAERMRMQLLSKGAISIVGADGLAYNYNYRFPRGHKKSLTGTDAWSNTKADVYGAIKDAKRAISRDTGNTLTRAICTDSVWDKLLLNEAIKGDILTRLGQNSTIVDDAMLKQWFATKLGLQVSVYNKMFKPSQKAAGEKFFPDDVFTLIPDGNLGNTYHGTTPEEAELMNGAASNAQVSVVNTGVAVTTETEAHPVNRKVIASDIVLPSFEAIDSVYIMNV